MEAPTGVFDAEARASGRFQHRVGDLAVVVAIRTGRMYLPNKPRGVKISTRYMIRGRVACVACSPSPDLRIAPQRPACRGSAGSR
jgi:hypothetical protein